MEQVIIGGSFQPLNTNTKYNSLVGGFSWQDTELYYSKPVSTDGIIKHLRVKLSAATNAAGFTFTLMVNGAPTALAFTISSADSGSDMVHEIDVTGGDTVSLRAVDNGAGSVTSVAWSCVFEGDTPNESIILGGTNLPTSVDTTEFGRLMGAWDNMGIGEVGEEQVCPTAGTIKNFYVRLDLDPGTSPDAYRFTLRVNGLNSDDGAGNPLRVTIIANNKTGNDTAHEITVAAGDTLAIMVEPISTPAVATGVHWGMTFVADIDGESIVLGDTTQVLDNAATEYNQIQTEADSTAFDTDEDLRLQLCQVCVLKKLYVILAGTPGAGNSYDITVRVAKADSDVTVHIHDSDTAGNSGALTDTVALDDYVNLKSVPLSTPTARAIKWGLVSYRAPIAGLENKSANMGAKMIGAGLI